MGAEIAPLGVKRQVSYAMICRMPHGWNLTRVLAAVMIVATFGLFIFLGWNEESVRILIRSTARSSLLLFLIAFSASSLRRLWRHPASAWLLRNRRYLGVSFAVSHALHLFGLLALMLRFDGKADSFTLVFGSIAYVFVAAMALTSNDRAVRYLGGKRWRILHWVGSYTIWAVFAASYVGRSVVDPTYIPAGIAVIAVWLLRIVAKYRPSTIASVLLLATGLLAGFADAVERIEFASGDGLEITADLYKSHEKKSPMIVLFHQAGWSRGEYREIAPKLNSLGFNCMAIDQRSGKNVNGVTNETAQRAVDAGKGVAYGDALQDMVAALKHARSEYAEGKLIGWGSSYSAGLVLKLAGDQPALMDAVLAFAPGEYFSKEGKPRDWVKRSAAKIKIPVFITSSRSEGAAWRPIFSAIPTETKQWYLPDGEGQHGSRALWRQFPHNPGYWRAVESFFERQVGN